MLRTLTRLVTTFSLVLLTLGTVPSASGQAALRVGFGKADITPKIQDDRPVWIAGYGHNRPAQGVHDPLYCRCLVLDDGDQKIAIASIDLVGLQYPDVKRIRQLLPELDYVLVSSSHNHEGPDVIGLWGPTPLQSGVDAEYLGFVVEQTAKAIKNALGEMTSVTAAFGTAKDATLLRDSRLPIVYDDVLRTIRFVGSADKTAGLLVQWSDHPESLGSKNQQITADFPYAVIAELERHYECPIVYVTGAVGGLMSNPSSIRTAAGTDLEDGSFEFAEEYGRQIAELAKKAVDSSQPVGLSPFDVAAKPVAIHLENPLYVLARSTGVLQREARAWTGDPEQLGTLANEATPPTELAIETEVAYLRLGEIHVAAIPGEIYPELVYGKFQEPVEPHVDFPEAPLEPHITSLFPSDKFLVIGLANDEVGYIIPRRQWDQQPPFAYDRDKSQYGEINSCGPGVAPVLMRALANRVEEVEQSVRERTTAK